MLSIEEITKSYPAHLQSFRRFILREYLQYKILEIIFDKSEYARQLSFLGGTCLRIVHSNNRFSEDLDFDNFNLSESDFEKITHLVRKGLEKEGYEVVFRNVYKGAFRCYIRFPRLLFEQGLSGHQEEKILIQLDTEAQHFDFTPSLHIVNRFDVFTEIPTTPLDILLSQKFYAILNRKRSKGRDFYDTVFLLSKTLPNYDYLSLKLDIKDASSLKERLLAKCAESNLEIMAGDVAPFLFDPNDAKKVRLFDKYIQQVAL